MSVVGGQEVYIGRDNENGQLDKTSMRITRGCSSQAGTDGSDGSNGSDGTDGHAALIEVESYTHRRAMASMFG